MRRYRIRLLPWVAGEKADAWIGVDQLWTRNPTLKKLTKAWLRHASLLTAAAKGMKPTSTDRAMEGLHGVPVSGNVVVVVVTTNHGLEPSPGIGNRLMPLVEELLADFRKLGSEPIPDRCPTKPEIALLPARATMGETQKLERLRFLVA